MTNLAQITVLNLAQTTLQASTAGLVQAEAKFVHTIDK